MTIENNSWQYFSQMDTSYY